MHKYYSSLFVGVFACTLFGCKDSVNNVNHGSPDILVDSSYLLASGGDPRGFYTPNSPFVFTFNSNDSLTSKTGEGTLQVQGSTVTGGTFALILTTKVSGKVGNIVYAQLAIPETTNGYWAANGSRLSLLITGRTDSAQFTADSKGLYLITAYFNSVPPFSLANTDGSVSNPNHPTIWVFKK